MEFTSNTGTDQSYYNLQVVCRLFVDGGFLMMVMLLLHRSSLAVVLLPAADPSP